jgi:hypothetical protein
MAKGRVSSSSSTAKPAAYVWSFSLPTCSRSLPLSIPRATILRMSCIRKSAAVAITWVRNCACQKPKELGYAQELWTYRLLTAHLRQQARPAGYPELERVSRSKLHKILMQGELRPHI